MALALELALAGCSGSEPQPGPDLAALNGADTVEPMEVPLATPTSVELAGGSQTDDALPLKRGIYVLAGTTCEQPANAAIRMYNGHGISGSATRDCRMAPFTSTGDRHEVSQSCVDTYSGTRTSERQVVTLRGREGFTLETPHGAGTYELCPDLALADFTGRD